MSGRPYRGLGCEVGRLLYEAPLRLQGVAPQLGFESKIEAKLKAVYHIVVSSA
jgi:hypothetical protein